MILEIPRNLAVFYGSVCQDLVVALSFISKLGGERYKGKSLGKSLGKYTSPSASAKSFSHDPYRDRYTGLGRRLRRVDDLYVGPRKFWKSHSLSYAIYLT